MRQSAVRRAALRLKVAGASFGDSGTTATTQTGEVAQVVLQSSEQLSGKLQVLQREVSEFVSGLRAA